MLVDSPRPPFSLDRLIAEARRRARQRRLLLVIAVAAVFAVTVGVTELATRSSGTPVSRSAAPGCAGTAGAAATLVRQDEARMLCLILMPPEAQLLTSEPAVMAREERIFNFPKSFAPYAQHRVWRVDLPVAAVVGFEEAHPPAGSKCFCGGGVLAGSNVPANAGLQFALPPIRGRIGSRVLRMEIIGLPDGSTAIRVDAVNRPWTRS